MAKKTYYRNFLDDMSPAEKKVYFRQLFGPPFEVLRGEEKQEALLLLALLEPTEVTNNQTTWTQVYIQNDVTYHIVTEPIENKVSVIKYPPEK